MALEAPGFHLPTTRFSLNRRVAAGFLRPHCQNRAAQSPFCLGKTSRRIPTAILAAKAGAVTVATQLDSKPVRIVALVGKGSVSPLKTTPWEEVMLHTVSSNPKKFRTFSKGLNSKTLIFFKLGLYEHQL